MTLGISALEGFQIIFLSTILIISMASLITKEQGQTDQAIVDSNPVYISIVKGKSLLLNNIWSSFSLNIFFVLTICLSVGKDTLSHNKISNLAVLLIQLGYETILICFSNSNLFPFFYLDLFFANYICLFSFIINYFNIQLPQYFTIGYISWFHLCLVCCYILFVVEININDQLWQNSIILCLYSSALVAFLWMAAKWILSLNSNSHNMLQRFMLLPIDKKCCFVVVLFTIVVLVIWPIITLILCTSAFLHNVLPALLSLKWSMTFLGALPQLVGGWLEFNYRVDAEARLADERSTKRATLNYLSHELRTPLNTVCNGVDFVMHDVECTGMGPSQERIMMDLADVKMATRDAIALLDDFMCLEKLETGSLQVFPVPVYLDDVISDMLEPLLEYPKQRGQEYDMNVLVDGREHVVVHIDKHKVAQVFRTLVTNAVKFTPPEGNVSISVRVEPLSSADIVPLAGRNGSYGWRLGKRVVAYARSHWLQHLSKRVQAVRSHAPPSIGLVVVEVVDTGCGTPEHIRQQVFDKFFRFDPLKQGGGGSGMGLWICKEVLERLGGSLECRSGPEGVGTVFRVCLQAFASSPELPIHCDDLEAPLEKPCLVSPTPVVEPAAAQFCHRSSLYVSAPAQQQRSSVMMKELHEEAEFTTKLCNSSDNSVRRDRSRYELLVPQVTASPHAQVRMSCSGGSRSSFCYHSSRKQSYFDDVLDPNAVHAEKFSEEKRSSKVSRKYSTYSCPVLRLHVAIADDSDLNRRMVRKMLQRVLDDLRGDRQLELNVEEFNDGEPALMTVCTSVRRRRPFDLVLLDNIMLTMNGPTAASQMREAGYRGPIIAITGNVMAADVQEFLSAGANTVLKKPVNSIAMKEALIASIPELITASDNSG